MEELIQQIEELYNDEKYEEAIELANEILKYDKDNFKAKYFLGTSYAKTENYELAENIAEELINGNSEDSKIYGYRIKVVIYFNKEDDETAINYYKKAKELSQDKMRFCIYKKSIEKDTIGDKEKQPFLVNFIVLLFNLTLIASITGVFIFFCKILNYNIIKAVLFVYCLSFIGILMLRIINFSSHIFSVELDKVHYFKKNIMNLYENLSLEEKKFIPNKYDVNFLPSLAYMLLIFSLIGIGIMLFHIPFVLLIKPIKVIGGIVSILVISQVVYYIIAFWKAKRISKGYSELYEEMIKDATYKDSTHKDLKLLQTEHYNDGSYTEFWQSSYDRGYAKTYSSNNKLIFMETIAADENGLKTIILNKYCYKDDLDKVSSPTTIYEPSVPEWKYEVHTIDSLNRCVLIEHYDVPSSDELLGKTIINYREDSYRTELYIDYSSYGASSTQTVYDSYNRKISEVEYFDPDAQNKARVTTFEYSEDNSVKTITTLNYYQTEIDMHSIRASRCIENSLTGYVKEINYIDYEMTQIRDITEFLTKEDGCQEKIHTVYNSNEDDDFSYKQISTPDNTFTKKEWFYDPEFMLLYSVDEIERDENGQTRLWVNKKYSKEGKLLSLTKQEFDENGDSINFEVENFKDTEG